MLPRVLLSLVLLAFQCTAYPYYWYNKDLLVSIYGVPLAEQPVSCLAHPSAEVPLDPYDAPHGSPGIDTGITFAFADAASGAAASSLCPGGAYTVQVAFGIERLALLTADPPVVTFNSPAPTPGCSNRVDLGASDISNAQTNFTASFQVPCNATGSVLFKVTSSGTYDGVNTWAQNSAAPLVADPFSAGCASVAAACGVVAPPPPPSPPPNLSPSPPPQPPSPLPPSPSPSQPPSPMPPPPSPPAPAQATPPPSGRSCEPSSLGYECMVVKGSLTLHWTINSTAAPLNACTPTSLTTLQADDLALVGSLHMAVQATIAGYVALGFSSSPGQMFPADVVLGWAGSSSYIHTFATVDQDLSEDDLNEGTGGTSWAYDKGVMQGADGVTTLCFSRRLVDARATSSPDLRAATAAAGADGAVGGRRRLQQDVAGTLGLNWAISNSDALLQHTTRNSGGFYLDVASGAAADAGGSGEQHWINVHGALMAVAWGLLLPLGTLLPAHRWVLGEAKVGGKHWWFWLHMAFQLTGMALFVAGFVVAYVKLGDLALGGSVGDAHGSIGIAVMAAAGAQVLLGFARPNPDHPRRGYWNHLHHNLGRCAVLLAWANVYIGIYIYHGSPWQASYKEWVTPIAVSMGSLVLIDVVLRLSASSAAATPVPSRTSPYEFMVSDKDNGGGGGGGAQGKAAEMTRPAAGAIAS